MTYVGDISCVGDGQVMNCLQVIVEGRVPDAESHQYL
jgi:hypothetical protein